MGGEAEIEKRKRQREGLEGIKADRAARVKESRRRWGWGWERYQLSQTKNNVFSENLK